MNDEAGASRTGMCRWRVGLGWRIRGGGRSRGVQAQGLVSSCKVLVRYRHGYGHIIFVWVGVEDERRRLSRRRSIIIVAVDIPETAQMLVDTVLQCNNCALSRTHRSTNFVAAWCMNECLGPCRYHAAGWLTLVQQDTLYARLAVIVASPLNDVSAGQHSI